MPLLGILEEFGFLENFTSDLYPYRYLITPILILAALTAGYFAYTKGVHLLLLRHRMATALIGVPMLVFALMIGDYMLSPLWERTHLEEQSPLAVAAVVDDATATPSSTKDEPTSVSGSSADSAFEPILLLSGEINGADDFHFGRGDVLLIKTGPDTYVLRFENFSVRNGPDLFVYLSEDPTGESVDEALNLGTLKATDGAFNYDIPPDIDVTKIRSVIVWCRQFATLFAHVEFQ